MAQLSPTLGRAMKEYDQQIVELKNENFNLKLRIYFLEEKLQQTFTNSSDDVQKLNIDLLIEVETLKQELNNKHELLVKASTALELMEDAQKAEMNELNVKYASEKSNLEDEIHSLKEEEISRSQNRIEELEKCLSDKDVHIKEVEMTAAKTHKFVRGILTALREKEKLLKRMQEQYDIQAIELKKLQKL